MKRSIKTLYKRQGKDTGGQEWVCTHCELTFDNPNLLNLHTLTHAAENVAMVDHSQQVVVTATQADKTGVGGVETAAINGEGPGKSILPN